MAKEKYVMTMSLEVLKHLGIRLYSNLAVVMSEVVANAYDADATEVTIESNDGKIIIIDNGHGMGLQDINDKFLVVGYTRREVGEELSRKFKRPVMGRKGIGKLSLFSIARNIEVYSKKVNENGTIECNGLAMNLAELEEAIRNKKPYHPVDIDTSNFDIKEGTKIVLSDFKRARQSKSLTHLRGRLARRFSLIKPKGGFIIRIDSDPVTVEDRAVLKKVVFLWEIGGFKVSISGKRQPKSTIQLNGAIDGTEYKVKGWIGTVLKPSELDQDGVQNNKISIFCRGKMAQEDILDSYSEGGIYKSYVVGELHADFLDVDEDDDIATSSRQSINEDDPRYIELIRFSYTLLKEIQRKWTELRKKHGEKNAVENAKKVSPQLGIWFENLGTEARRKHARHLFATIESLHFDKGDDFEQKKELYRHGILAFEKLKLRETLSEINKLETADDIKLASVFSDLSDIEASQYYDIAKGRVQVIKQFDKHLEANDKEALLQKYVFDNLWLLNPSWERPLAGSEVMETRVEKALGTVVESLTQEERNGRLDIKYRSAAGTHIIIELKRYNPTYKISKGMLADQIDKYQKALRKCLVANGESNPVIKTFVILGDTLSEDDGGTSIQDALTPYNAQVLRYDFMIKEALDSYQEYLQRQKKVGEIGKLVDSI